jgi:O-antigen/teichoic acid export membrane protein
VKDKIENTVEESNYFVKTLIPTLLNNGVLAFTSWFVLIIINRSLGVHQVGLFSTLLFLINIVLFVPRLSSNLILSRLVHFELNGHVEKLKQFLLGVGLNCVIVFIIYFIFHFNEAIITSFYVNNFDNIYNLLDMMILGTVFVVSNNMFSIFFVSEGKAGYPFGLNLIWSVFYTVLVCFSGDIESIALSYIASYVFLFFCNVVLFYYAFPKIRRSVFEKFTHN